jgi:hypothetical protein
MVTSMFHELWLPFSPRKTFCMPILSKTLRRTISPRTSPSLSGTSALLVGTKDWMPSGWLQ